MGRGEACTGFWWGNLRKRDNWGKPDQDRIMILRRIFRKWDVGICNGLSWLTGNCECGDEPSCCKEYEKVLG
jgi:hypothetical protein